MLYILFLFFCPGYLIKPTGCKVAGTAEYRKDLSMFEIKGKYATAKVFTSNIDQKAVGQVLEICNQKIAKGSSIRIMPDVHFAKACVIGFTAINLQGIIPNIIGVDIGCGMYVVKLSERNVDLVHLDSVINEFIPSGMSVNSVESKVSEKLVGSLKCFPYLKNVSRLNMSMGSLGGGNHFVELAKDSLGNKYLIIHSGSRNLGKQVAEHYQNIASNYDEKKEDLNAIVEKLKKDNKHSEIQAAINEHKSKYSYSTPSYLKWLPEDECENYWEDMFVCVNWAKENREEIARKILSKTNNRGVGSFHTVHNYIDFQKGRVIIRKGAVSAEEKEELLIPINMRDGSLLCVGKGNPDWNFSAPHGAGRIMSRSKTKELVSLEEFEKSMEGIFSSSVGISTLDEAPMAYKPMSEIQNAISDTVEIKDILRPIYNFKAH